MYVKKDITMNNLVNLLNLTYNIDIKRTSLSDKINKIPLLYFEQSLKNFQKLHNELFPYDGIKHIAVDGKPVIILMIIVKNKLYKLQKI